MTNEKRIIRRNRIHAQLEIRNKNPHMRTLNDIKKIVRFLESK